MAVAFDVATESHTGTTGSTSAASFTWNHTGGASAKGALVFVFSIGALTDTSVTYGGTTMLPVPYTAADTDTEPGSVRAYYLDACGTGTKAVIVNRTNNAVQMYAVCYTVTAAGPTEVYQQGVKTKSASTAIATAASSTGTGTGTLAEDTVDDGSPGTSSLRFMGRYQGTSNVTAAGANSTAPASAAASIDFGLFVIDTFYETTAGQGARNVGGATITDDVAAILLAVREIPLAGAGSATVTSRQPLAHVATMGGLGSATGTAQAPTAFGAKFPGAEPATITVTAQAPTANPGGSAGLGSATGSALDTTTISGVYPNAGLGSATGTAYQPAGLAEALAAAGLGSATGTALQPSAMGGAYPNAGLGAATGTAYGPIPNPGGAPGVGSATGTAQQPAAQIRATAGVGSATGTAQQPAARAEALAAAGLGSATGTSQSPTANPGTAPGVVAAIGAAQQPTAQIRPSAGLASATGTSQSPTVHPGAMASAASSLAAAYDASGAVAAILGLTSAVGTAWNPTVTATGSATNVDAELASATGTAWDATVQTLQPTTGGRRGVRRGGRPGQRKPLDLPPIVFLTPEAFAHPGVAQAIASAHGATTEWDDDETALLFLLGGLL